MSVIVWQYDGFSVLMIGVIQNRMIHGIWCFFSSATHMCQGRKNLLRDLVALVRTDSVGVVVSRFVAESVPKGKTRGIKRQKKKTMDMYMDLVCLPFCAVEYKVYVNK